MRGNYIKTGSRDNGGTTDLAEGGEKTRRIAPSTQTNGEDGEGHTTDLAEGGETR
ncbi:MAG TPA: hypothetical protein VN085_12495 [Vicinamibacterales bacterium]|nr:hypothetical protein [Vicinamibacterales bacterium]